jgi:hypothetical protein
MIPGFRYGGALPGHVAVPERRIGADRHRVVAQAEPSTGMILQNTKVVN